MASTDVTVSSTKQPEIVLRDLQSLLRKTISEQIQVISYKTKLLLPKGENYASTMLKVDAIIKKTKNSKEEELPLVAKMIPSTEFQQNMMDTTSSFNKEFFVFEKLLKVYRELEEEAGVKKDDQIDILPKYYGGRLSLDDANINDNKDSVLLMENLITRGYFTMNRLKGLDFNCAKVAISELARFHALGIAAKIKRPDFFKEARKHLDMFPFKIADSEFVDVTDQMVQAVCSDSRISKYEDRIKAAVQKQNWDTFMHIIAEEPWVTMIHGDFWCNNIMFHKENGKIDGIKFVDFQLTRATSPLLDIPYFLCCSLSVDVIDNHFDELIDIYYDKFINELKLLSCDISPYSRDNFEKQLQKDGSLELFHCLMAMKFFTIESSDDIDLNDMKGTVMLSTGSDLYFERSWKVVSKFVDKNWI